MDEHVKYLVQPPGIEPGSRALQARTMTTLVQVAFNFWCKEKDSNLQSLHIEIPALELLQT
jgi:hypothetical protein